MVLREKSVWQIASNTFAIWLLINVSYLPRSDATTDAEAAICLKRAVDDFVGHVVPFRLYVKNLPQCSLSNLS